MGTSSARRGPTTVLWRAAKGAATRYLSPEGGGVLDARELTARYLAALEETPGEGDRLAMFRFTRKVGQELGAFWSEINFRGWEEVLQERGLRPLTLGDPAVLAQGLSGVLGGSGGGLEEAVVRTSLAQVLLRAVQSETRAAPANLVRQFLAMALTLRLTLDLGESLEAAAGGYGRLRERLNCLKELIEANILGADSHAATPVTPEHWQGLTGWTWITETMAALMSKLGQ
ncbi:MAG: hypothetical protein ACOZFS_09515 [Thermodesulfobacteriota bacterium]